MELQVRIQDILEHSPLALNGQYPLGQMTQLVQAIGQQDESLHFQLELSRSQRSVFLKGELNSSLDLCCDLCLKRFDWEHEENLDLALVPQETQNVLASEITLSEQELDTIFYTGEDLDVAEILEEQLLLALPIKKVCTDSCQGLCTGCGANLNLQTCQCPPPDYSDSPFSKLLS